MTKEDTTTRKAQRRFRWILTVQIFWLGLVCVLGFWWGKLVISQAARIQELEILTGVVDQVRGGYSARTGRMVFWESTFFFGLLLSITTFLVWYHWRDMRRTKGIQAFFASVTHELRTPLTSIRLQAESIADSLGPTQNQDQHHIRRLLEDTMRLESQVERTLELARVEGGGPVFVQPLDIKPWLERIVRSTRDAYPGKIQIEMTVENVALLADPFSLAVIFKNLFENAMRHSKRLPVSITIQSKRIGHFIYLYFKDDGDGFNGNPGKLGKIFEKGSFSQGAGVGLYLTKVLMKRMGGLAQFSVKTDGFGVELKFREVGADA